MVALVVNSIDDFILVVSPTDRDITRYFHWGIGAGAEIGLRTSRSAREWPMLGCAAPLISRLRPVSV